MAKKTKTYELKNEAGAGIRIRFRPENAYFLEQTTGKTFIEDEDTRRLMRECFGRYMAQFRKLGDGELLAELRLGGEEMLSASFPYSTHGRKLPAKETAGYREKLKELETLGRDPGASERLRTIAERFPVARLENDPELFRVYRRDGEWRLAVIWGLTGVAGDTLRPVSGAQAPNPTGGASAFAARLLPWLVALLIALLALLAWHEFGKNTVEGPDSGPGGERDGGGAGSTGGTTNTDNGKNGGDAQGGNPNPPETIKPPLTITFSTSTSDTIAVDKESPDDATMDFPVTARRKEDGRVVLKTPKGIGENQKIDIFGEDGRELGSTDGKSGDYEIPNVSADVKNLRLVGFDKNGKKTGERLVPIEDPRSLNPPEPGTGEPPITEPPPVPKTTGGETQKNSGIRIKYTRFSDAEKGMLVVRVAAQGKRVREIEYAGQSYAATDNVACILDVSKDAADTKIVIRFDNGDHWTEDFKEALK